MLGSLLLYLSTGVTLQTLVFPLIPEQYKPQKWGGSYNEDLLTVLIDAHVRVLNDNLKPKLMPEMVDRVMPIALSLTHPNPMVRGDPKARKQIGRPVGIDRIQQKLATLAQRAAAIERGRNQK